MAHALQGNSCDKALAMENQQEKLTVIAALAAIWGQRIWMGVWQIARVCGL
jgi:hypothetical protein